MRFLITLIFGSLLFCPSAAKAGKADMPITVRIISKADWEKQNRANRHAGKPAAYQQKNTQNNNPAREKKAKTALFNRVIKLSRLTPRRKFIIMDINNDNFITRREYLIVTHEPLNQSAFDRYDRNNNGLLDSSEID